MSFDHIYDALQPIDPDVPVTAIDRSEVLAPDVDPWQPAPRSIIDFGYGEPSFSGGAAMPVTAAPKPGAIFPERVSLNLMPLWQAMTDIPRGLEVVAAPLKFLGVGEALKTVGESMPGQVLQNLVLEPFRAIGRLAERAASGEVKGGNVFEADDPWAQLVENAQLNASTIADVFEAISLIPAFKVAKGIPVVSEGVFPFLRGVGENLSGEGAKRILKGDLVGWATAPVKNPVMAGDAAYNWGKVAGRVALASSLAGYGTEKVIEGIAPDSWAAREIAGNRFVGEESAWRLPLDLAESLPLDIFGVIGKGKEALQLSRKMNRLMGPEDSVLVDLFPKKLINQISESIPSMKGVFEWIDNKSARDAAEWSLMDRTNVSLMETWRAMRDGLKSVEKPDFVPDDVWAKLVKKGEEIADHPVQLSHPNQLGFASQEAYDTAVAKELDNLMSRGQRHLRERQFDVIMGRGSFGDAAFRPGWAMFRNIDSPANRLMVAEDFHKWAKNINQALGDRIEPIVETNLGNQIEAAWGFLDNMTDDEFKAGGKEAFRAKYAAIANWVPRAEDFAKMSRDNLMSFMQKSKIQVDGLAADPMLKMGALEADLWRVIQEIVKKGPTAELLTKRGNTLRELRKIRDAMTKEHEDAIHGLMVARTARSHELLNTSLGAEELAAVNAELSALDLKIQALRRDYFEMAMIGSRYTIGKPPVGVVQPVFGPGVSRPENFLKGRTRLGEVIDSLFGAMPNKRLGLQSFKDVDAAFQRAGYDAQVTESVFQALREEVDLWRKKNIFGTSFNWAPFVSIYSLPTFIINRTVSKVIKARDLEVKVPEGYKDFAHIFYKAHPGPFKIFAREVLGKKGDTIGYSPAFVNLTRTIYPLIRFSLSPRFIIMNLLEAEFFQTFLGGRKSLGSLTSERMRAVAAQVTNARLDPESGRWVFSIDHSGDEMLQAERDLETLIRLANTWRADEVSKALIETLMGAPAMQDFLRDQGITKMNQLVKKLDDVWKERMGVVSGEIAETHAEQALQKEIREVRFRLNHPLSKADTIKVRSELTHLEAKYDDMVVKRQVAAAEALAGTPSKAPKYTIKRDPIRPGDDTAPNFDIMVDGKAVGEVRLILHETGKSMQIEWIGSKTGSDALSKGLGPSALRALAREVHAKYPSVEHINGLRIGGSFKGRMDRTDSFRVWKVADLVKEPRPVTKQEYRFLLDAVVEAEKKSIERARKALFANPDRSVMERTFNSYLLYWPLSYQIKAGKALLEFMVSHGFGYKTNLVPAAAIADAGRWIEEKKQTDPDVKDFFKEHSQLLFMAQQLFPALPDETGTSLSPLIRLPIQAARGYKTTEKAISQGTSIGPVYDWNLMQEFIKQESRPGGLFGQIFKGDK